MQASDSVNGQVKVMVVEDEAIIRTFISFALRNLGCRVASEVAYGEHAIDAARNEQFDLIFMDIRLKGEIDGVEAAHEISQFSNASIVFMSAYDRNKLGIEESFPRMLDYLVKPVHTADIQRVVELVRQEISGDRGE